jgi:hypothetical protein
MRELFGFVLLLFALAALSVIAQMPIDWPATICRYVVCTTAAPVAGGGA